VSGWALFAWALFAYDIVLADMPDPTGSDKDELARLTASTCEVSQSRSSSCLSRFVSHCTHDTIHTHLPGIESEVKRIAYWCRSGRFSSSRATTPQTCVNL
jgi:hypothetical protein